MINKAVTAKFNSLIPETARKLHHTLKQAGYATYIVGGWLRNIILEEKKNQDEKKERMDLGDIDFATAAKPEEVIKLFSQTHPTGIKHGTVTVIIENYSYEVTTFRQEGKYLDNRRPEEVIFSQSLVEDLVRRDFTVNAFAYEPETQEFVDHFNGIDDLEKKILRVISRAPELPLTRFQEDALRMMRACRLASQFSFIIEPVTLKAITESAPLIKSISQERIRDELIKTVTASKASIGLEYLRSTGILKIILPEFTQTIGVTQNRFHAYDVYHHSLEVLNALNQLQESSRKSKDHCLSLAGLFHDIAKPQTKAVDPNKIVDGKAHVSFYRHEIIGAEIVKRIMRRLKFSNQDISAVSHLIRHHMFYYTSKWKDGTIRRFVSKIKRENLEPLFLLRQADRLGKGNIASDYQEDNQDLEEFQKRIEELINEKSSLTLADLDINGTILMQEFSLASGPLLGYLLKQLLEQVLDDPSKNQKKYLLQIAQKLLEEKSNTSII